jgi:uncharacterized membrane protein YesL
MSRTSVVVAAAIAGVLALVGLIFGLMPATSAGGSACGSALAPAEWAVGCRSALSPYRTAALVFLVGAGLGAVFTLGAVTSLRDRRRRA